MSTPNLFEAFQAFLEKMVDAAVEKKLQAHGGSMPSESAIKHTMISLINSDRDMTEALNGAMKDYLKREDCPKNDEVRDIIVDCLEGATIRLSL